MEGTVDDFFNEIDQIAPPKECNKAHCDWQECFDSGSGYPYYWNTHTDQVTWDIPLEYKIWKEQNPNGNVGNRKSKVAPLFPSALPTVTKIYNIQSDASNFSLDNQENINKTKSPVNLSVNSINTEKVVLIPSYGDGSDSEAELDKETKPDLGSLHLPSKKLKENCQILKNTEEDDIDLLTKLQRRAKILKDLGGELPPDVKKIVEQNGSNKTQFENKVKKQVSGFSLVAGYGDSEDEDEANVKTPSTKVSTAKETKTGASTLFPIAKPIDIKQFLETDKAPETESIDTKVFHRKRRIGIDFNLEKSKPGVIEGDVERQGLGFKKEIEANGNNNEKTKINYPGFQSGGLIFIKSDVLNPVSDPDKKESESDTNKDESIIKKIEETHKMLNEKLTFLSEGRDPVSPVQIIIIQMETLYEAMKAGSLTVTYLHKWLKETCSQLVKLEKDAAPSGWLLQWDRLNKRYYYRNQQTGESQWEYPQPDIVGGDEAMDICTTPPPPITESIIQEPVQLLPPPLAVRPPPPPRIKSPIPPPPPIISKNVKHSKKVKSHKSAQLPIEILPSLPPEPLSNDEPLPPGVDVPQETSYPEEKKVLKKDSLGLELNSFYSDLAAMETGVTNTVPEVLNTNIQGVETPTNIVTKKRKKAKVKLVEGLTMKKKGVSKLVERWKNVQKDYN